MIIEKLMDESHLSDSEKQIARYLLDSNNNIDNLTSTELGKKSYTSQSTVIRLYQKMGIKSYREFLSLLIVERNEFFRTHHFIGQSSYQLFSTCEKAEIAIPALYNQLISDTNLLLDTNVVNRVCNRIMNAKSVDIYGVGISNVLAKQMKYKLQSLGLCCTCHSDYNLFYIQNIHNPQSTVSIIISLSDINETIKNICYNLREKNIYSIAICGKEFKQFQHLCDDHLYFATHQDKYINMICSVFSVEYIINIIYPLLISRCQSLELSHNVL